MFFKKFFSPAPNGARLSYEAIVAAARHDLLYAGWAVPDTVDGRFDMIALHMFLLLDRLKGAEAEFRQSLVDEMFADMDRALREMGVGDVSVGKKVRKMAEVFYGRVAAYDRALAAGMSALAASISRNVFPDGAPDGVSEKLASYALKNHDALRSQIVADLVQGRVVFIGPAS